MTEARFFVAGDPKPKGSTKSYPFKRKDGSIGVSTTNANKRTSSWEGRIATEAQRVFETEGTFFNGAVRVSLEFVMPRPKSLNKGHHECIKRPDLDKLMRTVLDGLTGTLIEDDALVVSLSGRKRYVHTGLGPDIPGVLVLIWGLEE